MVVRSTGINTQELAIRNLRPLPQPQWIAHARDLALRRYPRFVAGHELASKNSTPRFTATHELALKISTSKFRARSRPRSPRSQPPSFTHARDLAAQEVNSKSRTRSRPRAQSGSQPREPALTHKLAPRRNYTLENSRLGPLRSAWHLQPLCDKVELGDRCSSALVSLTNRWSHQP